MCNFVFLVLEGGKIFTRQKKDEDVVFVGLVERNEYEHMLSGIFL